MLDLKHTLNKKWGWGLCFQNIDKNVIAVIVVVVAAVVVVSVVVIVIVIIVVVVLLVLVVVIVVVVIVVFQETSDIEKLSQYVTNLRRGKFQDTFNSLMGTKMERVNTIARVNRAINLIDIKHFK